MSAHVPAGHPLLVVIDPAARATDGESVRIAKDVLCAGAASVKMAFPESAEEAERALAHRGRRHLVVLGDDAALLRTVNALRRTRTLHDSPVAVVPIGPRSTLVRALGVPEQVPAAARAVLDGVERELDLLVDESGGIVLGTLSLPYGTPAAHTAAHWWTPVEKTARSLVRTLTSPIPVNGNPPARRQRLRVEADGVLLADLDEPVHEVSVRPAPTGLAEIFVRRTPGSTQVRARARTITVSGRDFRYRADSAITGPVRTRTWTVEPSAWRLTVPR
ncbi:Diacylglycerol kinase catalytic domain-containing protein [Actinacidiphila yanglinensis]|uniref:Diacylglycerol kinase catalytic domain-containing protein n=1 Tax=Actinacidiphila yanglinensis TaxID=310779 RepID=A0A1H5YLH8_9ACTN|nr:acylglycerol kinase family protein [Actinacidiphila yanglinensis]SEG24590.1 Diacylglycerol kinase catalytic domain-containing protein [Actinacidiphila yanglinensis]